MFDFGGRPKALSIDATVGTSDGRALLSTQFDRRNLLITLIVGCVVNTCGMARKSNRRRASYTQWGIFLLLSQYSTVVLTVVRVMIAKYRKSGIWGYRSSLTPEPIELK